jgi:hypothetical protein
MSTSSKRGFKDTLRAVAVATTISIAGFGLTAVGTGAYGVPSTTQIGTANTTKVINLATGKTRVRIDLNNQYAGKTVTLRVLRESGGVELRFNVGKITVSKKKAKGFINISRKLRVGDRLVVIDGNRNIVDSKIRVIVDGPPAATPTPTPAPPASGGGSSTPVVAATFTVTITGVSPNQTVTAFEGTATGDITVTVDGVNVVFARAGVEATTKHAISALASNAISASLGVTMTVATFATTDLAAKLAADSVSLTNGAITDSQSIVLANIAKFKANQITAITFADDAALQAAAAVADDAVAANSITLTAGAITSSQSTVLANITKFTAGEITAITFADDTALQAAAAVSDDAVATDSISLGNGAISTSNATVLANITKFTANQVTAVTLTAAELATAGVAAKLAADSATLGAVTSNVSDVITNIAKVKNVSITAITLTDVELATAGVAAKLAAKSVTLSASGNLALAGDPGLLVGISGLVNRNVIDFSGLTGTTTFDVLDGLVNGPGKFVFDPSTDILTYWDGTVARTIILTGVGSYETFSTSLFTAIIP